MRGKKRERLDRALDGLGEALGAGELARARELGREAVREAERVFGERHPELVTPLYGLASALLASGDLDEAERAIQRAVEGIDPAKKGESAQAGVVPTPAQLLELWASAALKRGSGAHEVLERWIAACREGGAPERERLATALNQLALSLGNEGKRDAARALFEEALTLRGEIFGEDSRPWLEILYNAATLRPEASDLARARRDLERVTEGVRGDDRASRILRASAAHNLGVVLEEQGEVEAAREAFERALALREEASGPEDPSLRPTLVKLGQLAQSDGRTVLAMVLLDRALALARKELGEDHDVPRAIEGWKEALRGS